MHFTLMFLLFWQQLSYCAAQLFCCYHLLMHHLPLSTGIRSIFTHLNGL